ncbi:MAG: quinolinate synthase NadA [Planctomycetes bacterium]|nr:quinolinate synthase NadA [Planctomycetota bacterium]
MYHDPFERIEQLKREKNAVVLAHYYQEDDIQDIADFVGDSLQLAQAAQKTAADVIIFCGVHFMAETAKILNPEKIVVLPDLNAGCSLAESCEPREKFEAWMAKYPGHKLITYVNSPAWVKALSWLVCTSSNAEMVIEATDGPILFGPDKNLGRYLAQKTGRDLVLWDGVCMVHDIFEERKIIALKAENPGALVLAHPECTEGVLHLADYIGSTSGIIKFARESSAGTFIVATEPGVIHQMKKAHPEKTYIPAPPEEDCACNVCPHMRLITLEKVVASMESLQPQIEVDPVLAEKSLAPLNRMLALSK